MERKNRSRAKLLTINELGTPKNKMSPMFTIPKGNSLEPPQMKGMFTMKPSASTIIKPTERIETANVGFEHIANRV